MDTRIVTIDLAQRSYDIYIGAGLLYRMDEFVPFEVEGRKVFLVADENTEAYMLNIRDVLGNAGAARTEFLTLPPGEQTKSMKVYERVLDWMLKNNIARDSVVFAVGGGVIGDLAGFAAATAMRGVPYVQVPTSLLAQVDSSVGGKTGINAEQGKNLIGSFYQPKAVVIDIDVLKTLPRRELLAGYAEVVKYGLINDAGFFNWLEDFGKDVVDLDFEAVTKAIETSVKAKAAVVEADEQETGKRALLNLGHTFGHALEAAAGYDGRLLHGEAVSIGIVMAYDLSQRMGLCSEEEMERVEKHFLDVGLPTRASMIEPALTAGPDELLEIMGHDKKAEAGKLKFILANGIGEAFISSDVDMALVKTVLKDSLGSDKQRPEGLAENVRESFISKGAKGLWRSAFSSRA